MQNRILLVHLGAMGAVVRSTALVAAIRRQYPAAHITWVTSANMEQLLRQAKVVDRVLSTAPEDLLALEALEFDVAFGIDKGLLAGSILAKAKAQKKLGFGVDPFLGACVPLNPEAQELYSLGLSNEKKFFQNQKSENQLVAEALCLEFFSRDPYQLPLSEADQLEVRRRRLAFQWSDSRQPVIGINTGCGPLMPAKKLSVDNHIELIGRLKQAGLKNIVLLGGGEDLQRAQQIADAHVDVIVSEHQKGPIDGYLSINACDVVVTGDSLGMHLAIAAQKWVVAWFGPSCAQEIDLYDRGVKVLTQANCSPCWKRSCEKPEMCYDQVDLNEIVRAVELGLKKWPVFKQVCSEL